MAAKSNILPPDNLGNRQQALNNKVNDALANNIDFNTVKDVVEVTDVDRFFKIDLAAKYKNVDYILETLKLCDTLYVSRALKKSQWLYDDGFSHIINPEYLDSNIFPETSERVKRLILKTVAIRVRREDRAVGFFKYCLEKNLPEIAFKSLHFTNQAFKLNLIQNYKKPPYNKMFHRNMNFLQIIIGKSLALLEAYLEIENNNCSSILRKFRHLYYSVNEVKYLELCEKYKASGIFDKQQSIDIMTKHKVRVLGNPLYYTSEIEKDILLDNSTAEDVKFYLTEFMPATVNDFWNTWFIFNYSEYLDKIPHDEKYRFLKETFCQKYPGEDFEMAKCFYTQHYYKFMTVAEQEEWAENQIKSEKQVLGVGKDYIWYKFINFRIAFEEIKKYVLKTKEAERRKGIINVLIHSARNNQELETLFKYYDRKHKNELRSHKEFFIEKVMDKHNVFEFDERCWNAFYTLLLNVELYDISEYENSDYIQHVWIVVKYRLFKNVALFYHILHEKEMPEKLFKYLEDEFYPESGLPELGARDSSSILYILAKMDDQQRNFLYDFLFKFYMDGIREIKDVPFTNDIRIKIERYSKTVKKLMNEFYPFRKEYKWEPYRTSEDKGKPVETPCTKLLRNLRKDKALVMNTFSIDKQFENNPTNIDSFLKKLKIYFPDDLTPNIIPVFEELLTNINIDQKTVNACVKAIFELGDNTKIEEFMKQYAPESSKINHSNIDPHHLRIQKSICRFACIPRPPVPLSSVLLYMKGDYVQYCLHVFNTYPAILPSGQCIDFVTALIDAPVSIQKHALRLAFKCFDEQKLKQISMNFWENTKNVSVRLAIYKGLFNRQVEKKEKELFETLRVLTLDLNEDDDRTLFRLTGSNELSDDDIGVYKEAAWKAISQFTDKQPNIQRKCNLLKSILEKIDLMNEEFVSKIVDDHTKSMLIENLLYKCQTDEPIADLYKEKWNFTYTYIIHFATVSCTNEHHLDTTNFVLKKCLENWEQSYEGKHIYQDRLWDFYKQLNDKSLSSPVCFEKALPIFESMLKIVETDLSLFESYTLIWELQLSIVTRKVAKNTNNSVAEDEKSEAISVLMTSFGKEVGELISNMVAEKIFFVFHTEYVKDAMCNKVKELLRLKLTDDDDQAKNTSKALVMFSLGLVEFEMVETYMLAVQILAHECDLSSSDQVLVDRIKKCVNPDIQYALHHVLPTIFKG